MRISNAQFFSSMTSAMTTDQQQLSETQQQLSSGSKFNTPADDPANASNILSLQNFSVQVDQYQTNVTAATNQLSFIDTTLGNITQNVQSIRSLMVHSGDGSLTMANRQSIASELQQQLGQLAGLMNSKNAQGQYLFSGFQNNTTPYALDASGQYRYFGDEGQSISQISTNTQVVTAEPGKVIFDSVPSINNTFYTQSSPLNTSNPPATINAGFVSDQNAYNSSYPSDYIIQFNPLSQSTPPGFQNYSVVRRADNHPVVQNVTYVSGSSISFNGVSVAVSGNPQVGDKFFVNASNQQGLLQTIQSAVNGLNSLGNSTADRATLQTLISNTLGNLDNALGSISSARARVGARENVVTAAQSLNTDVKLSATKTLSDLTNVDFAKASSTLSFQTLVLQAAQQSFVKVANLSLFNFLGGG